MPTRNDKTDNTPPALRRLREKLQEIYDLEGAAALLGWDQSTYLPAAGTAARGRQMALMARLSQERKASPELGRLIDQADAETQALPEDSDDASLVRVARQDYERATRVPPEHLEAFFQHTAASYEAWRAARPENDFKKVRPFLEKTLDFSRAYADFFPGYDHIADPLIDVHERGLKTATVRALFDELRQRLAPLVVAAAAQPEPDMGPVWQSFPEPEQLRFGWSIIRDFGFDPARARQDKSAHPFMTKLALGDIRITTRVKERDLTEALFSTLHEAGHALYELGLDPAFEGTPLASAASSGVHESQSRLWENLVGRSRPFWQHYFPGLQSAFPGQLANVSLDDFYRAVNRVSRSLIRTDADELTYNLHVMIRFSLELDLLEGKLEVRHLPEAWNERYQQDLGITPPNDADGVLQDVHWYSFRIGGAFQSYTLGNIMSAQFLEAARRSDPSIDLEIAEGRFEALRSWLTEHVYRQGRKFLPEDLVRRATGRPLKLDPYVHYLTHKYGELYDLDDVTGEE